MTDERCKAVQIASFVIRDRIFSGRYPGIIFVGRKVIGKLFAGAASAILGHEVPLVSADMPPKQRQALAERLSARDPSLPMVVATNVWATGIDIKPLSWVVLSDPKGSAPIGVVQAAGRPRRGHESKDACEIINVDYGGRAAFFRSEHLADAGFTIGDREFISEISQPSLDNELSPPPPEASAPSGKSSFLTLLGYAITLMVLAHLLHTC